MSKMTWSKGKGEGKKHPNGKIGKMSLKEIVYVKQDDYSKIERIAWPFLMRLLELSSSEIPDDLDFYSVLGIDTTLVGKNGISTFLLNYARCFKVVLIDEEFFDKYIKTNGVLDQTEDDMLTMEDLIKGMVAGRLDAEIMDMDMPEVLDMFEEYMPFFWSLGINQFDRKRRMVTRGLIIGALSLIAAICYFIFWR
jgi:hypothetical protein